MTGRDGTTIKYKEASYKKLLDFIKKYGSYEEVSASSENGRQ
jgi:hypothetical protein